MTEPIKRIREAYILPCADCGKELQVSASAKSPVICWDCSEKSRAANARAEAEYLIGAVIEDLCGRDINEFDSITVRTKDGKQYELSVGGWEEHYIEANEKEL